MDNGTVAEVTIIFKVPYTFNICQIAPKVMACISSQITHF